MDTRVLLVKHPIDESNFDEVGKALASGSVVAFPTETVYGLGASALLPDSVREIFRLKGRPADNPLIVHLLSDEDLEGVVSSVPDVFHVLYEAFSPGPLTYVMPRGERIPDEVTAGLDTVAVRFPSQPAARALLAAANVPVVAPSANVSGRPSPTRAHHVVDDFSGRIPWIVDDGPCDVGLESTVIDLTRQPIRILRPGVVTAEAIFEKTGIEAVFWKDIDQDGEVVRPVSPGMKYRHYAPRAAVRVVLPEEGVALSDRLLEMIEGSGTSVGLFISEACRDALRSKLTSCHQRRTSIRTRVRVIFRGRVITCLMRCAHSMSRVSISSMPRGLKERTPSRIWIVCRMPPRRRKMPMFDKYCLSAMATLVAAPWRRRCLTIVIATKVGKRFRRTSTFPGWPVSEHTVEVLREFGIDGEGMTSKPVNRQMLNDVSLVITMTTMQREWLRCAAPALKDKIISMADVERSHDIADPFGETIVSSPRPRRIE